MDRSKEIIQGPAARAGSRCQTDRAWRRVKSQDVVELPERVWPIRRAASLPGFRGLCIQAMISTKRVHSAEDFLQCKVMSCLVL